MRQYELYKTIRSFLQYEDAENWDYDLDHGGLAWHDISHSKVDLVFHFHESVVCGDVFWVKFKGVEVKLGPIQKWLAKKDFKTLVDACSAQWRIDKLIKKYGNEEENEDD